MKVIKTKALVIKKKHLLKNDYAISLFTKDLGKISVLAKGIKKITSRRLSHIDTGNFIKVLLINKKETYYLQQTSLLSVFTKIKNNPQKVKYLIFVLFVLDRFLPENQEESKIFFLTLDYFSKLARGTVDSDELLKYFNQLFTFLGYGKKFFDFSSMKVFIEQTINEKAPLI
ncbi:MAG: DNA repair protein RecO [Caldisericia bacterium]